MDYLCPDIERLVACYTCGSQTLPPYRLCLGAHVSCPPCSKYLQRCACRLDFSEGPNLALDWVVQAMKLRCRYAMARNAGVGESAGSVSDGRAKGEEGGKRVESRATEGNGVERAGHPSDDVDDCDDRWYSISELCDHYRSGCRKNIFTCPLPGCGHVGHVDTIVEHYEDAHGPFEQISPEDPLQPKSVTFKIDFSIERPKPVIRKIFNGYFLLVPRMPRHRNFAVQISLQNINPSDPLQYIYSTSTVAREIMVNISLNEILND